jgi:radical SAM superfamily enzyme with C-terminal helix-hairpin-helix motif
MKALVINCYSDEPTCLNVPPYIGKQPRYIAGAIWTAEKDAQVVYSTIDNFRKGELLASEVGAKFDLVIFIAGMTVPGKYAGGELASGEEIISLASQMGEVRTKILAGPAARFGFGVEGGKTTKIMREPFEIICRGDEEAVVYAFLKEGKATGLEKLSRSSPLLREFSARGAKIISQIDTEYLIAEIETYRGCPRVVSGFCSFCSEASKGLPDFRPVEDICAEVSSLASEGVHAFRLGDQPDLFAYMGEGAGKVEYPKPNPKEIEKLFSGVRRAAPGLTVLHIDNVNPGTIARHPEESLEVAKIIAKYNTPGDIAAFGLESLDPVVVKANNLKVNAEEATTAVEIINKAGNWREGKSLPKLLPGLNFIGGLAGETKNTFKINYSFLEELLVRKLIVRRINLRQVMPLPGTRMAKTGEKLVRKHSREFASFKHKVRENIDHKMLSLVAPIGTRLPRAWAEYSERGITFLRELGSYPLLVGVPAPLDLKKYYDLKVVGWGMRSITAVPADVDINTSDRKILELLPGIGKRNIVKLLARKPVSSPADFIDEPDARKRLEEFLA